MQKRVFTVYKKILVHEEAFLFLALVIASYTLSIVIYL